MTSRQLAEFLQGSGERPYRLLVDEYSRQQSPRAWWATTVDETARLPEQLQPIVSDYVRAANARYGLDEQFWKTTTCRQGTEWLLLGALLSSLGYLFGQP